MKGQSSAQSCGHRHPAAPSFSPATSGMHRQENKPSPLTANRGEGTGQQWFPSTGAGLSPTPEWHISLAHRMLQGSWHMITRPGDLTRVTRVMTWVILDQGAARGLTEAPYWAKMGRHRHQSSQDFCSPSTDPLSLPKASRLSLFLQKPVVFKVLLHKSGPSTVTKPSPPN